MFTGIVDHCGEISAIEHQGSALSLSIQTQFNDIEVGESISVDGMCLTALPAPPGIFQCNVSQESLALTIAGDYHVGQRVNLERALQLNDRLGGHVVTGHIDGRCQIKAINTHGEYWQVVVTGFSKADYALLTKKGSVAINGVSLTLNAVSENEFEVMLIPHTLERTNLTQLTAASLVNIEYDCLAKNIQHQLQIMQITGEQHEDAI